MGDIKPLKIANVLEKSVNFALSELTYEYSAPNDPDDVFTTLTPDSCSISLLANIVECITFMNGGVVAKSFESNTSLSLDLSIQSNVIAKNNYTLLGASLYSPDTLFRSIKRLLLTGYPSLVKSYVGKERRDNGLVCCAPKDDVKYIQDKPNFEAVPDSLVKYISDVSEKLYQIDNVFSSSITITNACKLEFFVDSGSSIVQFKPIIQLVFTIEYLNKDNNVAITNVVDFFESLPTYEQIDELHDKCVSDLEKFEQFFKLRSGIYPVLLKPSASDVFFHEALAAHLLSATYIVDNMSTVFKGRIGEVIPSLRGIDVYMDPSIGFGSYIYDHEGVEAQKVYLIKDGMIMNYLSDRNSASILEQMDKDKELIVQLCNILSSNPEILTEFVDEKHLIRNFKDDKDRLTYLLDKCVLGNFIKNSDVDQSLNWRADYSRLVNRSNGHSRVESWAMINELGQLVSVLSEARMSNLIVENTQSTNLDLNTEMLQLCKDRNLDFYLEVEAHGGHVEVDTALFVIEPNELIKVYTDGRRDAIDPGTFALHLEDFLKNVYMVGSETKENKGFCGAASGFVPVGSRTPSMILLEVPYQEASESIIASDETISILTHK